MKSILLTIYLFSIGINYLYFHLAFSKGGIQEDDNPEDGEIYVTFMPGINTLHGILMWCAVWPVKITHQNEPEQPSNTSKFFRIKK